LTLDYLVEEGLTDFQKSLQRALSNLPHRPSDMANVGRLREGLRDVLALLNYERSDQRLTSLPDDTVDARVVAQRDGFKVVHLHLPRLRASVERPAVERVIRQHPNSMIVATSRDPSDLGVWHFINVKEIASGRRTFRRAVVEPPTVGRTVLQTLSQCRVEGGEAALNIQQLHETAFDIERVTERFYEDYKRVFDLLVADLTKQSDPVSAHAYTQQLLNRLMFLYFIQRKRRRAPSGDLIWWLNNERDFLLNLWTQYRRAGREPDTFYSEWLRPLFFMAFNRNYGFHALDLPSDVKERLANLPWLNGGLFSETAVDRQRLLVRDEHFVDIFRNLLQRYNFTTREDTPLDVEVAVDPEMLGKVYESLVIQQERGQAGIFYTPRIELDFMCRRSLIEYLADKTTLPKKDLIALVLNAESGEGLPALAGSQRDDILDALDKIAAVDPACGSGAFLVGMMEVLMGLFELLYAQKGQTFDRFQRKKQIISRNLYGVDIKEWAIRVAELRLWLTLVIETEEAGLDVTRPLLPNLSFRLRVGDSLVEEIAGQQLALRMRAGQLGARLTKMVRDLSSRKAQYFRAERDISEAEIRRAEQALLRKVLEDRADLLSKEISRLRAVGEAAGATRLMKGLDNAAMNERAAQDAGRQTQRATSKSLGLEAELAKIRTALADHAAPRPFLWEIDFAEVFYRADNASGGFDVVVGNPPYVRNEDIVPLDTPSYEPTRAAKQAYKDKLYQSVQVLWGAVPLDRACDYYVYFYFSGLSLLREGGVFCFINSNSWLDVEYGAPLQEFLLRRMHILDIYDNQARRTFKTADINTVITIIRRPGAAADNANNLVRFVAFKRAFEETLTGPIVTAIESMSQPVAQAEFRVTARTQKELLDEGMALVTARVGQITTVPSYRGSKWGGLYLRAPDIFFDILSRSSEKLVRLGDIAEVDSGINTRANDFFYLKRVPRDQWLSLPLQNFSSHEIPEDCQVVRSEVGVTRSRNCEEPLAPTYWVIESRFLRPILVSPQESPSILVDTASLQNLALSVYEDWDDLKGTLVRMYIEYAMTSHPTHDRRTRVMVEGLAVNRRPELSKRKQSINDGRRGAWWYTIRDKKYGPILLPEATGDIFRVLWTRQVIPADHRVFSVILDDWSEDDIHGLALYLNSTFSALQRELVSRANLGQGGLLTEGVDWEKILCPRREFLGIVGSVRSDPLLLRPVLALPSEVRLEDRRALDERTLEAIGIPGELAGHVAEAAVDLVESRLARAATFKMTQASEKRLKAVDSLRGIWTGVPDEITEGEEVSYE